MDATSRTAAPSPATADAAGPKTHEIIELEAMSPASPASQTSPTGQDKSPPLQYAEFDPHGAPEVVVSSGASTGDGPYTGRDDDVDRPAARSTFWDRLRGRRHAAATGERQHDGSDAEDGKHGGGGGGGGGGADSQDGGQRGPVVVTLGRRPWRTGAWWAGCVPRAWHWGREKPYLAAAAASLVVGILALIILPIVLHGLSLDGSSGPTGPTTTTTTAPAASSVASSAAATSTGTAGTTPAPCKDNTTWAANVSFMGIAGAGAASWPYKLLPSAHAVDCCTTCYAHFAGGCQGWSFLPWDNTPVPCTLLYGWNTTAGVTAACPNGRAPIVFATDPDRVDSVGSTGPCGSADS